MPQPNSQYPLSNPFLIPSITLTNQSASIPTTTWYTVPSNGGGMYLVFADILVTTAGIGGTVVVSISWNNGVTSAGLDSATFSLTAQGEQAALLGNFMAAPNSVISYFTTVANSSGNPIYTVNLRLLYLGS